MAKRRKQVEIKEVTDMEEVLREAAREALELPGASVNGLAKKSGISHAQLLRFLSAERELRLPAAGRLAEQLGLKLVKS